MTGSRRRVTLGIACAASLTCGALAAVVANPAGSTRFYVTSAASSLVDQGLAAAAPTGSEAAAFQQIPAPGVRFQADEARSTRSPWIDSNAWRFQRGLRKAYYATLPAGSAPLAAAEAYTFDVEAILDPDPADIEELGRMLRFLAAREQPPLPAMANIAVVDNDSPLLGEVLNLLTRRNLLYRVVSAPDPAFDLTVQLGTENFPAESAADPSEFAARVRAKLGDDQRLVRLYGTSTVIAHLTGDGDRARLYLLNYNRGRGQGGGGQQYVRVRLLGRYEPTRFSGHGAAQDAKLTDIEHPGNTTEFWVPGFAICAIVDLDALK